MMVLAKAAIISFIGPSHKCDGNEEKITFSLPLASATGPRM